MAFLKKKFAKQRKSITNIFFISNKLKKASFQNLSKLISEHLPFNISFSSQHRTKTLKVTRGSHSKTFPVNNETIKCNVCNKSYLSPNHHQTFNKKIKNSLMINRDLVLADSSHQHFLLDNLFCWLLRLLGFVLAGNRRL